MKQIQFIIALLLSPLSIWYAVGVAVRNLLFSLGIKKSVSPEIHTVGIGNLRMGGTGKTPHTEYLIRQLSTHNIALLSRGYGRKTKGFLLANAHSTAEDIGDEPAMIARKFPSITVAVCEDRVEGVRQLARLPQPPDIVLLDDVFQHRSIKPDVMILLTEYYDPYSEDFILPFGNLREFRSGCRRADIVIVTKCPPALSQRKRDEYRHRLKLRQGQQLLFSRISYQSPQPLFSKVEWEEYPHEVLLVTGIAHPEPLKQHLERHCTVVHLPFPDHHVFTDADCQLIVQRFMAVKDYSKAIITTEKDAMRLLREPFLSKLAHLPVFYMPIEVALAGDEKSFLHSIEIP